MANSYNPLKCAAICGAIAFLATASVISVPAEPTTNRGQRYIDECARNHVPIPPRINQLATHDVPGWKSQGIIPGTARFLRRDPAELLTFDTHEGVCFQLRNGTGDQSSPLTDTTGLDDIICLSTTLSKACFWEYNRDDDIPAGVQVPIGVPDSSGLYAAGGAELEDGNALANGNACTDCHAGENPFIVHPRLHLKIPDIAHPGMLVDSPLPMNQLVGSLGPIPMFAPARYDPIVEGSWPQNVLLETAPFVPMECKGCHNDDPRSERGGRFPYLSSQLPGYCFGVLAQAIQHTMPPELPPVHPERYSYDELNWAPLPAMHPFSDWCNEYPTSGPSDRGDPHLTTTNGIKYDFQPAGEFTALHDSSNGFELQARQTPITTSFVPDANAYTGLQSCVSLNTAVALRVGKRRITYQQRDSGEANAKNPQLRIDGALTNLSPGWLNLGGGNSIANAAPDGGIDVRLADGTRVIVVPINWASEGYWYLDVEVINSPARAGTMGTVLAGNWLPLAPDGTSFGPAPAGMAARYTLLNKVFAKAWRVKPATSLFDYAPGMSTATFTDPSWPPPPGQVCNATIGPWGPPAPISHQRKPVSLKTAEKVCRAYVHESAAYDACVFDVRVMGDTRGVSEGYRKALALRAGAM